MYYIFLYPNTVLNAQATNWLDGTWIGIAYQVGTDDACKVVFKSEAIRQSFKVDYPSINCQGDWELIQSDDQKASFRQKIPHHSESCNQESLVVITKISDDYVTYSSFFSQNRRVIFLMQHY